MTHNVSVGFFYITDSHEFCYTIRAIGWYWWIAEDSSLPETDPIGPFESFNDAQGDANEKCDGFEMWRTIC